MPQHDNSKSKPNASNILENRWVKCNCLLPQQLQQRKKYNQSFIMQYVCANPFCFSDFPFQTHTHTRQQLLADGMEGCIDTCLQSAGPENCRQQNCELRKSDRETCGLYFTSPIFFASVSYINSLHIFTMKTSASSSRT